MMTTSPLFTLKLFGPFRLTTPDGERIAVSSKKGVALIAMLAVASEGGRARGWLQDKLWGKRQQPEARGSLRRELSNLRKRLNRGSPPLLICERDRVRLNLELLTADLDRFGPLGPASGGNATSSGEFLEGLDIAGEEGFEDWLREQRSAFARYSETRQSQPTTVRAEAVSAVAAPAGSNAAPQPARGFEHNPSLAVLPFENLTGDPGKDYLASGIGEELIDRLSRLRWLPIIARSSSFSFSAADDRDSIRRKLGASYLLHGSLRQFGDSFRISANLSELEGGYTVWSQRFELPSPTSADALEQCVSALVAHLDAKIDHGEQARAHAKPQDSQDLNDLIWRGRWHLNRLKRADNETAQRLFAEALALNPHSPEALIQATNAVAWSIWTGRHPRERVREMRNLAQRAMLADPEDGRGYWLAGTAETWLRNTLPAQHLLRRAIVLNPSLSVAHAQLGCTLNLASDPTNAIGHLKTALRLSPNDVHLFFTLGELAMASCMLSLAAEAIDYADLAIARRPTYWYAHMIKIDALRRLPDMPKARAAMNELLSLRPKFSRRYIEWIPFVDRSWVDHFVDSIDAAA